MLKQRNHNKKSLYFTQGYSFIVLFILSAFAAASPVDVDALDLSRFSFTVLPTIPTDDGSLSNYGLGYHYNDKFASEIRLNIFEKRTIEEFSGIDDSLNVVNRSEWRWFFLPLQYSFIKNDKISFSGGLGVYYYREKLEENGYFSIMSLDTPVNAYINNFSMNFVGPIVETEFSYTSANSFKISVRAELVPFAFFNAEQTVDIIPLFDFQGAFSNNQSNWGAMYFRGELTVGLFDLVDISAAYNGTFLTFDVIDFDADYNVLTSGKKSYSQSIQIEGVYNLKINSFNLKVGVGGLFNSVYLDSTLTTEGNRFYFIFGGERRYF